MDNEAKVPIRDIELRGWIEFCCWCIFLMTPIIWWLQGPSVTADQLVMRTTLLAIGGIGAIGMRVWAILPKRR